MIKLTTVSPTTDVDQFLRELAYSPYAYHIDDDPSDIIWNPHHVPSAETMQILLNNRFAMRNHATVSWDLIWEMYATHWDQAKREERVTAEVQRLLEQYGLVDSAIFDDQDERDALITEEWTTCIIDAMNRA